MPGTPGRVPRVSPESQRLDSVIRVRVHAHQSQRSPCLPYCRCACHHVQVFRSSNSLHNAVGALFIGYAGYPFQALQECTEACSTSKSSSEVYVYYVFPTWLLTRAVAFTIGKIPHGNINLNLSTRRVIPIGAEIFRLIKFNDVDNIKELLRLGLASPYDSDKSGISVLAVRKKKLFMNGLNAIIFLVSLNVNIEVTHIWSECRQSSLLEILRPTSEGRSRSISYNI